LAKIAKKFFCSAKTPDRKPGDILTWLLPLTNENRWRVQRSFSEPPPRLRLGKIKLTTIPPLMYTTHFFLLFYHTNILCHITASFLTNTIFYILTCIYIFFAGLVFFLLFYYRYFSLFFFSLFWEISWIGEKNIFLRRTREIPISSVLKRYKS